MGLRPSQSREPSTAEIEANWELAASEKPLNPIDPLRDPKRFAKVAIEFGTIVWPDDGLDMAPEPLYEKACQHPVLVDSSASAA